MDSKDRCYSYEEINEELLTKFSEGSKSLESLLNTNQKNKSNIMNK